MGTSDSAITRGWWRENANSSASAWKAISPHSHRGPGRARQQRRGAVGAGASPGSGHSPTGRAKVPSEPVGHLLTIIRTESCREIKLHKAFLAFLPVAGAILTFVGGRRWAVASGFQDPLPSSFGPGKPLPSRPGHCAERRPEPEPRCVRGAHLERIWAPKGRRHL